MSNNRLTDMYGEFDNEDDLVGNDDDLGALGSILSWEDEAEGSEHQTNEFSLPMTSAPPDTVQFSTTTTFNTGDLSMQVPLPTPIDMQRGQQQQQAPVKLSSNFLTSQQVQQQEQQQKNAAQHQQFLAQNTANLAQLFAQQAGSLLQQQSNSTQQQAPIQSNMQQQQQQQQPVFQQQFQLPFTADPSAFLQQLQLAQLQQQMQAAQQQQQQQPNQNQQQQIQMPSIIQQQLQAHFAQAQASAAPVGNNSGLLPVTSQVATDGQAHTKKKKSSKKPGSKVLPKSKTSHVKVDSSVLGTVSASDTEGENKLSAMTSDAELTSNLLPLDMTNMSPTEKIKINRDRNREHARNTRLRKKAYLEKLKSTVDELCRERDTLVSERSTAANLLVEMHNTRTEVLMSFFALRTSNEKRRKLWSSIVEESCFACVMPVTPYRSFPASEVQVSKCMRTVMGVDGIMSDTASLHVLFDTMIDRSRFPNGKIIFRYTLVTEEAVVAGNQVMARWVMTTTNAVQLGANVEVSKQGMLCCKFNSAHKIIGLELMFDVMAFMLQLKQATGVEGFAVVPNTVQTCQRNFDKPMVVTLAEPPYTIIQVNKLWEDMTGFTASEVVGKVSCSILQFPGMDSTAVNAMMQEIRFKRPASAMLVNKTKSGALFSLFLVCYPLSMDSRITYYLGLTLYYAPGDFNEDRSQDQLAPQSSTSTLLQAGAFSGSQSTMMPPMMFPGMVSGGQMGVLPTASIRPPSNTASRIMDEIQRSGSIENVKNDGDANITR